MAKSLYIFFLALGLLGLVGSLLLLGVPQLRNQRVSLTDAQLATNQPAFSEPSLPSPTPTPQPITLIFTGDLMFDRHVREKAAKSGNDFIFAQVTPLFATASAVIANLEGPITNNPSRSVGSEVGSPNNFIFTFDPSLAPTLQKINVGVVNLGNNHIRNFGLDGILQTHQYLTASNIQFFGNTGSDETPRTTLLNVDGLVIALVSYNQFVSGGESVILDDITSVRNQADLVIVMPHWGLEYETIANQVIQTQAHQFIDAGADAVIGSHPHVIQQKEVYKGKSIYYSLGNFVFDQYFSEDVRRGLLVTVTIDPVTLELKFSEQSTYLEKDGQTRLLASPSEL